MPSRLKGGESSTRTPRFVLLIVGGLLACHALLLARGAAIHSPTVDEIGHLPAGLSHWTFGRFDLYRVNPPLVRSIAAVPVFLARPAEFDWLYVYGASELYPEGWEAYVGHIPEAERGDLVEAYHRRLISDDRDVRVAAAKGYYRKVRNGAFVRTSKELVPGDSLSKPINYSYPDEQQERPAA